MLNDGDNCILIAVKCGLQGFRVACSSLLCVLAASGTAVLYSLSWVLFIACLILITAH